MAVYLEIATDLRVKDLLPDLLGINGIEFSKEIDSVNYGEGFDLKYYGLDLRLYDDERSDAALADDDFRKGELTWDQVFEKVVKNSSGKGLLKIEIERHDKCSKDKQLDLAKAIIEKLKEKKYNVFQHWV